MPGGDRTGPWGQGAMTGRGAGFCAGFAAPGSMNPGWGGFWRGGGFGRGGGRGYRHRYYATGLPGWARAPWGVAAAPPYPLVDPIAAGADELTILNRQAEHFESALQSIKKRIAKLESTAAQEGK
jgi:hypothetical protein